MGEILKILFNVLVVAFILGVSFNLLWSLADAYGLLDFLF